MQDTQLKAIEYTKSGAPDILLFKEVENSTQSTAPCRYEAQGAQN
jgi:hypothetical protein